MTLCVRCRPMTASFEVLQMRSCVSKHPKTKIKLLVAMAECMEIVTQLHKSAEDSEWEYTHGPEAMGAQLLCMDLVFEICMQPSSVFAREVHDSDAVIRACQRDPTSDEYPSNSITVVTTHAGEMYVVREQQQMK